MLVNSGVAGDGPICDRSGMTQPNTTSHAPVLVTGAAGFVGRAVCERLLAEGRSVIGVDNMTPYYDVALKQARLATLEGRSGFSFRFLDLADKAAAQDLFERAGAAEIIHLAAQPGVRYSLHNPLAYADSNLTGFLNVLEGARHGKARHLVYASSSSVYGDTPRQPFSETQSVDHPVSLYAATKKANELMAHSYAHLFRLPVTGLRFFTVYGPWGRPDMAVYAFTRAAFEGREIELYNNGAQRRDFTFIDDIVEGILGALARPARPDPGFDPARPNPATSNAPYRVYNIGNNQPSELMGLVELIEKHTGRKLRTVLKPAQPGDVRETYANIDSLHRDAGFTPKTSLDEGVARFVAWYRDYHRT